ncbi:MAG: hypothetical protein ABSD96_03040 [Candidatus Korobacteraceae bacterium]|jgi:hypothetical protein
MIATTQAAVLPGADIPYFDDQPVASASAPLDTSSKPGFTCLLGSQEGLRFFRGTLLAALLSLPVWVSMFLIVRSLR